MKIEFHKYQGAGNDFVLVDNRDLNFPEHNTQLIKRICDRRFGVGADGLILLQNHAKLDFEMLYFNADGNIGSMCGNGGRCVAAFAQELKLIKTETAFHASDGKHEALLKDKLIMLKMADVIGIEKIGKDFYLNTGSPHYVRFVENLAAYDVVGEGRKIRNSSRFKKLGTNVNYVEPAGTVLKVRTYERGVEDETLSCGTGVTAVALVAAFRGIKKAAKQFSIATPGGKLKVSFEQQADTSFKDIWLHGPAEFVYKGMYNI